MHSVCTCVIVHKACLQRPFVVGLRLRFIRRPKRRLNRAFLAAQPLSHLQLTNTVGLNFLTQVCILPDDDWEVTKPSVA